MDNVLITGGMGFIGTRLAKSLVDKFNVVLVDNLSYSQLDNAIVDDVNILDKCKFVLCDASDDKAMENVFKNFGPFKFVFHLAGIAPLPDNQLNKLVSFNSNVKSTLVVLNLCQIYGCKRFMLASSNSVYENSKTFPLTESQQIETTLFYPTTKLICEQIAKSFQRTYNMPVTIFRFANVYGPGMDVLRKYPPVTGAFIKKLYFDEQPIIYGSGKQKRDFIFVDDLVQLINLVINENNNTKLEIINAGTNECHSVIEQLMLIEKIMGKDIEPKFVDSDSFWKGMPDIYNGTYVIDSNVLDSEVHKYTRMNNTYAIETYNWRPLHTFESGMKITVDKMTSYLKNN